MKFPISRRKREHLEKVATFQERLENINGLTDPAEKLLLLKGLQQDMARNSNRFWCDRHDKGLLIGLGGGVAVAVVSCVLFSPLVAVPATLAVCAFGAAVGSVESFPEMTVNALGGKVRKAAAELLKTEGLERLAASPHLEAVLEQYPALKTRFDAAAKARQYRKALLPMTLEDNAQSSFPKKNPEGFRL